MPWATGPTQIEAPTDALVRVTMASICGTDIRAVNGAMQPPPGTAIGHEFAGIVQKAGSQVRRFKAGDRVVSPFSVFCGGCFYCKKGLLTACEHRQVFGFGQLGGAQSEYVRVPMADAVLEPLPAGVSDTQSAFLSDIMPGTFAALQLAGLRRAMWWPSSVAAPPASAPSSSPAPWAPRASSASTITPTVWRPPRSWAPCP